MLKNNLSIDQIAAITDKTADEIQAMTEHHYLHAAISWGRIDETQIVSVMMK